MGVPPPKFKKAIVFSPRFTPLIAAWEVTHRCTRHTESQVTPPDQSGTNGGGGRAERLHKK